jgi:hypothetical protein
MLIGWCAALLPADRASWAAAMKAEVDVIEDGSAALSFAFGCICGSIKDRTFTWAFAARSVQFATIGGMVALSLLSAMITKRMIDAHAESALIFGLTSALFGAAAMWSYLRGPIAVVQTACLVIPIYILAYALVSSEQGMASGWVNERLYQALAIEGVVIWATLLTAAIFMLRVEALPITKRM